MNKLIYGLGGGLLAGMLVAAPAMATLSLSVQPSSQTVSPGGTFSVDIQVSGRQGAGPGGVDEIIRAYDFLLGYDSTLLTATGLTFSNYLNGGIANASFQGDVLNYNPVTGTLPGPLIPAGTTYNGTYDTAVEFSEVSLLCYDANDSCFFSAGPYLKDLQAIPPDALTLVTVNFQLSPTAVAGTSLTLDLMDDSVYNPNPGIFNAKGILGNVDLVIALNDGSVQVPEPGTLALLLGVGLLSAGRRVLCRGKSPAVS